MKREEFLKSICPSLALSMLAAQAALVSCAKAEEEPTVSSPGDTPYDALISKTGAKGYFEEGKNVYINVKHPSYANLQSIGKFVNDETNGMLLVRDSETTIMAFDNCCPHQGVRNRWSFANNRFTCGNHGHTFGTQSGQTAICNSNAQFGNLKSYVVSLNKELVTVQKS